MSVFQHDSDCLFAHVTGKPESHACVIRRSVGVLTAPSSHNCQFIPRLAHKDCQK